MERLCTDFRGLWIRLAVPKKQPIPSCANREEAWLHNCKEISDQVKKIVFSRQLSSQGDHQKMYSARVQHASILLPFPSVICKTNGSQHQPVALPSSPLKAVKQNFLLHSHYHVARRLSACMVGRGTSLPNCKKLLCGPWKMTTHRSRCFRELLSMSLCLLSTAVKTNISQEWKHGL